MQNDTFILKSAWGRNTWWSYKAGQESPEGTFDMRDHIDHCFTCMAKTLAIEKQVALILKDVYDFSVKEIAVIIDKSQDVVKHLLQDARHTMNGNV